MDIDELLVSQPDYGEQALEIADMLVRSGAVDIVAIDSVAALTPRSELEGQMGDQTVGLQARMMSQAMRKLAGNLNRTQTLCVFTNQIREKVGVMFGSPETQPGGRALKFYSSQRLDIRRIETLKDGTEAVGNRVRVKVVKNKVAAPFRQAEFDIEFGKGISTSGCILDLAIEHNMVTKSGSFFSYGDERLGQGRNNAKALPRRAPRGRQGDRGQDLRGARHRPGPRPPIERDAERAVEAAAAPRRRREPDVAIRVDAAAGRRRGGRSRRASACGPRGRGSSTPGALRLAGARPARAHGARAARPLRRKRVEPEETEVRASASCASGGYVDDARYAQRFAEDRRRLDAWGSERIERRLRELGVEHEHDRRRRSPSRTRRTSSTRPSRCCAAASRPRRRRPRARPRARHAGPQGLRAGARERRRCADTRALTSWTERRVGAGGSGCASLYRAPPRYYDPRQRQTGPSGP